MLETSDTAGTLVSSAAERLSVAGVADPRREAEWIWSSVSGMDSFGLSRGSRDPAPPEVAARFDAAIARRAGGEPLAYVTGTAGFRRLTLRSDRRALIPRPETEGLVDMALGFTLRGIAADIGTGTGAVALALRSEGDFDEVIGADVSIEALDLARANGVESGLAVTWLAGDLVTPLAGRHVDLLVSNPPYLSRADCEALEPSVREFEPAMALFGGPDGLEITRRLFDEARRVTTPGGWIAIEIDSRRGDASRGAALAAGWQDVGLHDDVFGRVRYLSARNGREP
ncbi:MAG: peptide chain release factor N(5)-glutamine methyltransferase [Gemmatimonadales bacterium]